MTRKANQETDRMLTAAAEAAKAGPPQAQTVQPAPLPNSTQVGAGEGTVPQQDGTSKRVRFVVIQYQDPHGSGILWYEPDQADMIADGLHKAAAAQRAGLVLPG